MAAGVNQQHEANGHSSTMSALTVNTARAIGSPLGAEAKTTHGCGADAGSKLAYRLVHVSHWMTDAVYSSPGKRV
jgi:hypothetical protein